MDPHTEATEAIHFLHQKGWAPATSSNYSFRKTGQSNFYVSQSGIDKGAFTEAHFLQVDERGNPVQDSRKPSAETLLHCAIYRLFPEVHCVLHTHTVLNTILSQLWQTQGHIELKDYEILKGFSGIKTHEVSVKIPIFANTQDIAALSIELEEFVQKQDPEVKAFLIAGHGMYTWGATIADAKRHVEVVEFLLECEYLKLKLKSL
ncbi:MAG: methylthioribulose 1-phosphate dehydratase [Haliscomenobacter sp.]|nr:methylthioribulose 1-phosphate dehydratase [Haliscomenobacter sp.]MBK9489795.1 methylthioribulose 1-phosphate dehydratase [Haliscomenobacter sp.]